MDLFQMAGNPELISQAVDKMTDRQIAKQKDSLTMSMPTNRL